jgi:hypothetical protein
MISWFLQNLLSNGVNLCRYNSDLIVAAANLELKMGLRCLPGGTERLTRVSAAVAKSCKQAQEPRRGAVHVGCSCPINIKRLFSSTLWGTCKCKIEHEIRVRSC